MRDANFSYRGIRRMPRHGQGSTKFLHKTLSLSNSTKHKLMRRRIEPLYLFNYSVSRGLVVLIGICHKTLGVLPMVGISSEAAEPDPDLVTTNGSFRKHQYPTLLFVRPKFQRKKCLSRRWIERNAALSPKNR